MANRTPMDSHFNIFDYWKDKCITKNGEVKIDYGYPGCTLTDDDIKTTIPVVVDWGEPMCWCCGRSVCDFNELDRCIFDKNESLKEKDELFLKKVWGHKKITSVLQRAHIIPCALKGKGTAENLFLVCNTCHLESPDAKDPKFFLRYIYDERKNGFQKRLEAFNNYLHRIGLYLLYRDDEMQIDKNIGTHSATFTKSSLLSYDVMTYIEGYKDLCNMSVKDVKEKTGYLSWVNNNLDKRAEPYINIENKLLQLTLNPSDDDISRSDFIDLINHTTSYDIAEMISEKYKCNCF